MKQFKNRLWILFITVAFLSEVIAAENPDKIEDHHLFRITRSRDTDEIMYDLNIDKSGKYKESDPINIYWIRKTKNDQKEPLTFIQKKYGYGIKMLGDKKKSENEVLFQLVSFKQRTFSLKKGTNGSYKVFTYLGDIEVIVTRIFVEFEGDSFWTPTITKLELQGVNKLTGELISDELYPQ